MLKHIVLLALYPIVDSLFLVESTLRLWRAGFPIEVAFRYSRNR